MDERGEIVHYDTDHYTSVVHLLRACPELYRYCHDYKVQAVRIIFYLEKSRWSRH